jgi:hypothetical protein
MVKVFEGYGNTAFRLRFQDEFGNPVVEGITVRLEPPQLPQPVFHRGDADGDGEINITDGVFTLNFLFHGGRAPVCREAANANDDADLNITDGVYLLNFLFLGGPAPPAPGPATFPCGPDPEGSPSDLGCVEYGGC